MPLTTCKLLTKISLTVYYSQNLRLTLACRLLYYPHKDAFATIQRDSTMHHSVTRLNKPLSIAEKARLNICIAKDLADSFGGRKADYLIRLNQKLRLKISIGTANVNEFLAIAA